MLRYSNTHRTDPNAKKYALKYALTIFSIAIFVLILTNYAVLIWHLLSTIAIFIYNCFVYASLTTTQFLKPVFQSFGQYLLWGFFALSLWSFCVFFKIDSKYEVSKFHWKLIGLVTNLFFLTYNFLYIFYLHHNQDPFKTYVDFYFLFFYFSVFSVFLLLPKKLNNNTN